MLKFSAYRDNPAFPYDFELTLFNELIVYKETEGYWSGYWKVTYDFNGNVKTDHFPIMTKGLWRLIWSHFRSNVNNNREGASPPHEQKEDMTMMQYSRISESEIMVETSEGVFAIVSHINFGYEVGMGRFGTVQTCTLNGAHKMLHRVHKMALERRRA